MIRNEDATLYYPVVWTPNTIKEAYKLKMKYCNKSCFIAGGTLLQTYWEKGIQCPDNLISIENIKELQGSKQVTRNGQSFIDIGAITSLDNCRYNPIYSKYIPIIVEAIKNIASPAIRNRATIGGNIANGHGDVIPALLVLDSYLSLYDGDQVHFKKLAECIKEKNFLLNSILVSINIPVQKQESNDHYFYKKVGFREVFSQSIVTLSGYFKIDEKKVIEDVRLAVCGSSLPPQTLVNTEKLMKGLVVPTLQLNEIAQSIKNEFNPPTDHFSSSYYKQKITTNIIVSEIAKLANK